MSTVMPRSRAMSAVRSTGKPYVSYSRNTSTPGIIPPVARVATSLKMRMPESSVSAKRSSSALSARSAVARPSRKTG